MLIKKIMGALILGNMLLGLFVLTVYDAGLLPAIAIWGIAIAITALIFLAVNWLMLG